MKINENILQASMPKLFVTSSGYKEMQVNLDQVVSTTDLEMLCERMQENNIKSFEVFYMEVLKMLICKCRTMYSADLADFVGLREYVLEISLQLR